MRHVWWKGKVTHPLSVGEKLVSFAWVGLIS